MVLIENRITLVSLKNVFFTSKKMKENLIKYKQTMKNHKAVTKKTIVVMNLP